MKIDFGVWVMSVASGNGIAAMPAPGMAAGDAFQGEPAAFKRAIFPERLQSVIGTGGLVPTGRPQQRRKCPLIQFYQDDEREAGYPIDRFHGAVGCFILWQPLTAENYFNFSTSRPRAAPIFSCTSGWSGISLPVYIKNRASRPPLFSRCSARACCCRR